MRNITIPVIILVLAYLDALAEKEEIIFETKKLGDIARFRYKGRTFILLKPNTFMNLSGKAVNYWQKIEKIPLENVLVITDDLNLSFGTIRLKQKEVPEGIMA